MTRSPFLSIDQNSHTLWDTVPKLAALARHGWSGTHFVEDIDVAFTRRGAQLEDSGLDLVRERYYRGGVSDWGATLFYTDVLGRQPLDLRQLEPYTGWKTAALARRLEISVDELYDLHSPSDNWQLVGTSYCGDAQHHRLIGDLSVAEVAPFVRDLLDHAQRDMESAFPERAARERTQTWCAREGRLVDDLLRTHAGGRLVDLYQAWVAVHAGPTVRVALTSDLLAGTGEDLPQHRLLAAFVTSYEEMAANYNTAIEDTGVGVSTLHTRKGELPFFVVLRRDGHLVRTGLFLRDGELVAGDAAWPLRAGKDRLPLESMREDGVMCIVGKALLLVLHARMEPTGGPLVLPYLGSLYMPAAHDLETRLRRAGVLTGRTAPLHRVRFDFLRHWQGCQTVVRLPEYLHDSFGTAEMTADAFAEALPVVMRQTRTELEHMQEKEGRERMLAERFADEMELKASLEAERRQLARDPETRPEAGRVWDRAKELDRVLLEKHVARTVQLLRVRDLEFHDSRGALMPWSIALGGDAFYERVLEDARIYAEDAQETTPQAGR